MSSSANDATAVFLQAIEIVDLDERAAFLDRACGANTSLRQHVESLLHAHDDAGRFLGRPTGEELGAAATDNVLPDTSDDALRPPVVRHTEPAAAQIPLDFLEPCVSPGRIGKLGTYEIIEVIGQGGMGIVLKAHDTKLNRTVAIKVLAPMLALHATAAKRFFREAQAAAAVSHDHVVTIFAVEESSVPPYLVMECIVGESLQQKIDRRGSLETIEILRIGRQIAEGLAAAHQQGLIHRDIKPSNILLENGVERVKITDFGLARAADDVSITQSGHVTGTPQYMSPEQAQGLHLDARSDLFSLGSLLYAMCTGRPAFAPTAPWPSSSACAKTRRGRLPRSTPRFLIGSSPSSTS